MNGNRRLPFLTLQPEFWPLQKLQGPNPGQVGLPAWGPLPGQIPRCQTPPPPLRFPDCVTIGPILLRPLVTNGFTWLRVLDFRPGKNSFLPCWNHPEYLLWGNFRPVQHPGSRVTPCRHRKPITIGGAGSGSAWRYSSATDSGAGAVAGAASSNATISSRCRPVAIPGTRATCKPCAGPATSRKRPSSAAAGRKAGNAGSGGNSPGGGDPKIRAMRKEGDRVRFPLIENPGQCHPPSARGKRFFVTFVIPVTKTQKEKEGAGYFLPLLAVQGSPGGGWARLRKPCLI